MPDNISFDEFSKVDIRMGTIIEVSELPKARKPAYKLKVDFGSLGIKNSSAQISKLYTKDQLTGRQILAVINFKPKQIASFISECLVLGVANQEGEIVLLQASKKVKNANQVN